MDKLDTVEIFDYPVFNADLNTIQITGKMVINTLNQFSFNIAEKDPVFKSALVNSDILLPDGIGIVGAVWILKGLKIKKIAGADLHDYLLHKLNEEGGKCFYLGSSNQTLAKIKASLANEFPNIQVETYSPPFKPEFDAADNAEMIKHINAFKPDVLFVGMTAPKQEKWATANKDKLDVKIAASIGAVFDYYSGTVKRADKIWIKLGLEWLARLIIEPYHVWKRYVIYGPVFLYIVLKEKLLVVFGKKSKH